MTTARMDQSDVEANMGGRPASTDVPRIVFDPKLLLVAAALGLTTFFVPPLFRMATIASAFAMLVLAPMPDGTRRLTFAIMVGLATGTTAISSFAVSIFQAPVTQEFGWQQTEYSTVLTIVTLILVGIGPFAGRLFDRRGVRHISLGSTIFLGLALISLHWLTHLIWHFYLAFAAMQLFGVGTSSIAYSRIVARWFAARRGQAFGTALAGVGIGGAVVSALSQYLIGSFGWRNAYVGLGLFILCVTLPILFLWLRDTPEEVGLAPDGEPLRASAAPTGSRNAHASRLIGHTAAESRRLATFWQMLFAFFIMALGTGGVMLQLIPILRSQGITAEEAAATQGALGLALIAGRAFAGFLMDRMFAPRVAAVVLLFPMVGTGLLAYGAEGWIATVASMCLGLAAGAEVDIIAVLITRYFGTRAYAENYGWLYAAWALGSGTAPLLTAFSIDHFGSYGPALWLYVGAFAVSSIIFARLGAYPRLAAEAAE